MTTANRGRVGRLHFEQQSANGASERAGPSLMPATTPERHRRHALRDDQPEQLRSLGAERHADADLVAPARHRVRDHAVDAKARHEQRRHRERQTTSVDWNRRCWTTPSTRSCMVRTGAIGRFGSSLCSGGANRRRPAGSGRHAVRTTIVDVARAHAASTGNTRAAADRCAARRARRRRSRPASSTLSSSPMNCRPTGLGSSGHKSSRGLLRQHARRCGRDPCRRTPAREGSRCSSRGNSRDSRSDCRPDAARCGVPFSTR